MPPAIFEPSNAAALRAYEDITIALYGEFELCEKKGPLMELGRCATNNYTKFAGSEKTNWAPEQLMYGICAKQCKCNFCVQGGGCTNCTQSTLPKCADIPDDPKTAHWCSLCGPKYNKPILTNVYTCGQSGDRRVVCPGPEESGGSLTKAQVLKKLQEWM